MANGIGQYAFSVVKKDTNATVVHKVSGEFSNGKLNGEGKWLSSDGAWEIGTYREGNRWNTTSVGFTKGVRYGTIWQAGKQVGLCREDIAQPSCTPELQAMMRGGPPSAGGKSYAATSSAARPSSPPQGTRGAPQQDAGSSNAASVGVATTGVKGAPDLLGFRIGEPVKDALRRFNYLGSQTYAVKKVDNAMLNQFDSKDGIVADNKATVLVMHGPYKTQVGDDIIALFDSERSNVKILIRTQGLKNRPFRKDLISSLDEKLRIPQWSKEALLNDQPVTPWSGTHELPIWGVTDKGENVRLKDCFIPNGFQVLEVGGDYRRFSQKGLLGLKPNYCRYAIDLKIRVNTIDGGNYTGQLANSYTVTIFDFAALSEVAIAKQREIDGASSRELNNVRSNASKPVL